MPRRLWWQAAVKIDIITIFPGDGRAPLAEGVVARGRSRGVIDIAVHDLRDYTTDRHHVVDDMPFGGGPGMVLKPEPLFRAVEAIRAERGAAGRGDPDDAGRASRSTHADAERLSGLGHMVVLCGRYEGVDERVRAGAGDRGDFDRRLRAVGRRTAGAGDRRRGRAAGAGRGRRRSVGRAGTRSREGRWTSRSSRGRRSSRAWTVPPVLLSGHHAEIERWRRREALARTLERRPELLERRAAGRGRPPAAAGSVGATSEGVV